jgi:hypothetical protein
MLISAAIILLLAILLAPILFEGHRHDSSAPPETTELGG